MVWNHLQQEGNEDSMSKHLSTSDGEKENCYRGLGITIWHDPLTRKQCDNVMGVFYEEQVLTWRLLGDDMVKAIENTEGSVDFLDVGTGSGFWAILMAKQLNSMGRAGRVLGVDKVNRAVGFSERNMRENDVLLDLKLEEYNIDSALPNSVRVIFMNPPYHIYPTAIEDLIPHHARGGGWGYEEFVNWLSIANYHLSENGSIFFHHMSLGDEEPEFIRFIPKFIGGNPSIEYYEIFPSIDSFAFLKDVYREKCASFIYEVSEEFPKLHYTSGVIVRDGLGRREKKEVTVEYRQGKSWQDRVLLHRGITEVFCDSDAMR
jgi:SAM-dependent methyltransferase